MKNAVTAMKAIKKKFKKYKGGEVIDSGGYGCVFSPAIPEQECISINKEITHNIPKSTKNITKLMLQKYAIEEYKLIKKFYDILKTIPNYQNYFLLNNIHICRPKPISKDNLKNFSICDSLEKKNIDQYNINNNLDKVLALSMENGGQTLSKLLKKYTKNKKLHTLDFAKINTNYVNLLNFGIIPMNNKGVFHCDLKESNILINDELMPRIIDWGISYYYVPISPTASSREIPGEWPLYAISFNTPYSSCLMTNTFISYFNKNLPTLPANARNNNGLLKLVSKFVVETFPKQSHYYYINELIRISFYYDNTFNLNGKNNIKDIIRFIENKYTIPIITNYLYKIIASYNIITNFSSVNQTSITNYLNRVYIYTIDIWGFIVSYYPIYKLLYTNYRQLDNITKSIYNQLKYVYTTYLFTPNLTPINITNLTADLNKLTPLFAQSKINNSFTSAAYT